MLRIIVDVSPCETPDDAKGLQSLLEEVDVYSPPNRYVDPMSGKLLEVYNELANGRDPDFPASPFAKELFRLYKQSKHPEIVLAHRASFMLRSEVEAFMFMDARSIEQGVDFLVRGKMRDAVKRASAAGKSAAESDGLYSALFGLTIGEMVESHPDACWGVSLLPSESLAASLFYDAAVKYPGRVECEVRSCYPRFLSVRSLAAAYFTLGQDVEKPFIVVKKGPPLSDALAVDFCLESACVGERNYARAFAVAYRLASMDSDKKSELLKDLQKVGKSKNKRYQLAFARAGLLPSPEEAQALLRAHGKSFHLSTLYQNERLELLEREN
ncbi:hypothetical protein HY489_04755 [Candidatus Woesearchaeota archaeon]|nr:hypothetical protein [Candidatus Woesearchaeota archaeon]